jgi:hypothetical protein
VATAQDSGSGDLHLPGPLVYDAGPADDSGSNVSTCPLVDVVFLLDNTDATCVSGIGLQTFEAARQTISEFENAHPSYRVGLVIFPGCPNWPSVFQLANGQSAANAQVIQCVADANDSDCADYAFQPYWLDIIDQAAGGEPIAWDLGALRFVVAFTGSVGLSRSVTHTPSAASLVFAQPWYVYSFKPIAQVEPLSTSQQMLNAANALVSSAAGCN